MSAENPEPTQETQEQPRRKLTLPWYYATRGIGAIILVYGVFGDHSEERGTIILTGAGLLGLDKVARSEGPPTQTGGDRR